MPADKVQSRLKEVGASLLCWAEVDSKECEEDARCLPGRLVNAFAVSMHR